MKGWKIRPKVSGDPLQAEYVRRMAEAQRKLNPPTPKPVKPEGMSHEDWIFSMQPKSMQEIITAQKDPDYKRDWTSPLPENTIANPNAKNRDELVGLRKRDPDQESHIEAIRRRSKNTLGQSELSSVSKESRERAAHHFVVTPPALLTEDEMNSVKELTAPVKGIPATQYVTKKITTWQAFVHWIKGGKVWTEKE